MAVVSELVLGKDSRIQRMEQKEGQTLFAGGSKITADGDLSNEIKRRLLLGRKVMTNLDSIFKETLLCQQRSI